MVFCNRSVKAYPGWVITEANDYHLAKTAIKTGIRCKVPTVNITEKIDGLTEKYANVKQTN